MAVKPLVYTRHAAEALSEREIDRSWVAETIEHPDWTVADPAGSGVERRYKAIRAFGDRILRVVCLESAGEVRILTAFFDRKARRPQ
ncbi:DUF4258 domain-containing protein [Tianweitania sp. BSSL-BM11]|uniref:DUF4258 domain-containing protein n=1 Tax=Tianweitania aestuarii TaxID=2814886 RepID=A0ABS5RVE8_9HYPH|nr:DUF4258 domain-containing protein [Tianweitania aestuarii]